MLFLVIIISVLDQERRFVILPLQGMFIRREYLFRFLEFDDIDPGEHLSESIHEIADMLMARMNGRVRTGSCTKDHFGDHAIGTDGRDLI